MSGDLVPVPAALLRPYASVLLLRCLGGDPATAFGRLHEFLEAARRTSRVRVSVPVASAEFDSAEFDQVTMAVHRVEQRPGWLTEAVYLDVSHELTIAARRGRFIALHAPGPVRDALRRWLDGPAGTTLRRVPAAALEGALLRGEAKSLWLRGTHPRRSTKVDSKAISGTDLRFALSPFDDATFAVASARSALGAEASGAALRGTVGTTPHRSLVWNRQTESMPEFLQCIGELITVVERALDRPAIPEPAFPVLAQRLPDLTGVGGAYDASRADLDERPDTAGPLDGLLLEVTGTPDSADFDLDVTGDGAEPVRLRGEVGIGAGRVRIRFGFRDEPADRGRGEEVLDALDQLTVYYASGHAISGGGVFRPRISRQAFPNWSWADFAGRDITREKPRVAHGRLDEIHLAIGADGDRSLFGWVVEQYGSGFLTCDDGAGEVADFVHVDHDGTLSLVHVKSSASRAPGRHISASAFQVVVAQAVKNVLFLEPEPLARQLRRPPVASPACWVDGRRVPDRAGLLRRLARRDARDRARVVIVQPSLSKRRYDRLYAGNGRPSDEMLRLRRLENLLNSARPTVAGVGADLHVIGSAG
ncbi:hypothetical protein GCM10023321_78040 [Pseudonocardia eucalypti]|uniref:Uncharacterized protein n=1 Tax=Pseudonocardia eucalypti TaxID=648755 RepID=A0ABP9RC40_9PSEU|nr:hypothetical protein [Pseudonocardia eucalypti]